MQLCKRATGQRWDRDRCVCCTGLGLLRLRRLLPQNNNKKHWKRTAGSTARFAALPPAHRVRDNQQITRVSFNSSFCRQLKRKEIKPIKKSTHRINLSSPLQSKMADISSPISEDAGMPVASDLWASIALSRHHWTAFYWTLSDHSTQSVSGIDGRLYINSVGSKSTD